jgi:hypothetical protein
MKLPDEDISVKRSRAVVDQPLGGAVSSEERRNKPRTAFTTWAVAV